MLIWLLENTLFASALALLALVAGCRSDRKPALCHLLWGLVLVRLVLPPLPSAPWSPPGVERGLQAIESGGTSRGEWQRAAARIDLARSTLRIEEGGAWRRVARPSSSTVRWVPSGLVREEEPGSGLQSLTPSIWPVLAPGFSTPEPQFRRSSRSIEATPSLAEALRLAPEVASASSPADVIPLVPRLPGLEASSDPRVLSTGMTDDLGLARGLHFGQDQLALLRMVILSAWGTGALLLLITRLRYLLRLRRSLSSAARPSLEIRERSASLCKERGLRSPELRSLEGLPSPLLIHFERPFLLLPATLDYADDEHAAESVLRHELAHLERRDGLWMYLELLASILHWWNPLFWFAQKKLHWHAALAADAAVRRSGAELAIAYQQTLRSPAKPGLPAASTHSLLGLPQEGRSLLDRRIASIMNDKRSPVLPRRSASIAVLLFLALSPSASGIQVGPQEEVPDPELRKELELAMLPALGDAYYACRDWKRVESTYERILARDDRCGYSLQHLAAAKIALKSWDSAREVIARQEALGYALPSAALFRARIHAAKGETHSAWQQLERALTLGLSSPKALQHYSELSTLETADPDRYASLQKRVIDFAKALLPLKSRLEDRKYNEALALIDQLLDFAPRSPQLRRLRGYTLLRLGRAEEARKDFQLQLAAKFRPGEAHYYLASCAARQGDKEGTKSQLEQAIANGLDNPLELFEDGDLRTLEKDPELRALEARALRFARLEHQAELWKKFHQWKETEATLEDVVAEKGAKASSHGPLAVYLGRAQLALGKTAAAAQTFRRQIKLGYKAEEALSWLARVALAGNDDARAMRWLRVAIQHGYSDAKFLHSSPDFERLRGKSEFMDLIALAADRYVLNKFGAPSWEYLRDAMQRLLRETKDDPSLWHRYGWAQLRLENHAEAQKAFRKQDALGYSRETARYNLACSYALTSRVDEAFRWLDLAIEAGFLDPGHLERDPDLANLRSDPRFKERIERSKRWISEHPELYEKQRKRLRKRE